MSYSADALAIKSILKALYYKELENNLDLETEATTTLIDKGFTLKAENIETKHQTNRKQLNSVIATLVISYSIPDNTKCDMAIDSFKDAVNALSNYHYGYFENPSFKRHEKNNKWLLGTAKFYIGVEQC